MTRIAVTSRSFSRHPVLREELQAKYADVKFNDDGLSLSGESLVEFLQGCDRAITALERIDGATLDALPDLKVVSKYGVGLDMIDLKAMASKGVQLGWTGGVNKRSVSELVIAMAISLLRHIPLANAEVREGTWRQHMGRELSHQTVGIVGCGHVGKDLGRLLRAFGCQVLAHDILDFREFYKDTGIKAVGLEELLRSSDIVSLHLPLDETTRDILDAEHLRMMQKRALLINASRGGLVDEDVLYEMLTSGDLAGAGFDVFSVEPPENHDLVDLQNFITTPHIGGSSEEAILAMGRAAIAGLESFGDPSEVAMGIRHDTDSANV